MQFKWVRYCLSFFSSLILAGLFLYSPDLNAVITLNAASGGSVGYGPAGSTIYYFVTFNNGGPSAPTSPAFMNASPLNLSATAATDPSLANMFQVKVTTTVATNPTGNQVPVVTLTAYPTTTSAHPVPIAAVNGVACSGNNCQAQNLTPLTTTGRYYAAKFQPGGITIGFYPSDICQDYSTAGGVASGCNNNVVNMPSANTTSSMQLAFAIAYAPDSLNAPSGTPVDSMTQPVSFTFGIDTPQFGCASSQALNSSYIPGDGQIFFNTTIFGISGGDAPPMTLIIVGQDAALTSSAPDVSSAFQQNNTLVSPVAIGNVAQPITGFTNSTEAKQHKYSLSFLIQDAAGIYAPAPSSCELSPVQTSQVQGFLNSSRCFIATAAFRSYDAEPLALLREFRDEILLHNKYGEMFVHWYYNWSPGAADWLIEHPVFRFPVLLLLWPLEVFAWFCLYPIGILLAFGIASMGMVFLLNRGNAPSRKESEEDFQKGLKRSGDNGGRME